jgi:hypothetical protein
MIINFRSLDGPPYYLPPNCKYSVWINDRNTGIVFSEPDGVLDMEEEIACILINEIARHLRTRTKNIEKAFIKAWRSRKNIQLKKQSVHFVVPQIENIQTPTPNIK